MTSFKSLRAFICSSSSVELGAGVRHVRLEITALKIRHDKFFQFVRLHNKDAWQVATVRPAYSDMHRRYRQDLMVSETRLQRCSEHTVRTTTDGIAASMCFVLYWQACHALIHTQPFLVRRPVLFAPLPL